jgi:SepF-like predicted cell division protein (DUF552 family)
VEATLEKVHLLVIEAQTKEDLEKANSAIAAANLQVNLLTYIISDDKVRIILAALREASVQK